MDAAARMNYAWQRHARWPLRLWRQGDLMLLEGYGIYKYQLVAFCANRNIFVVHPLLQQDT